MSIIIQVIEIKGYELGRNVFAFDSNGKRSCKQLFETFCGILKKNVLVYYESLNFKGEQPYTYTERFFRIFGNQIDPAKDFESCDFYERTFFTANDDNEDQEIICSIQYIGLNDFKLNKP